MSNPYYVGNRSWRPIASWLSMVAQFIMGFVQVRVMLRLATYRSLRTASALVNRPCCDHPPDQPVVAFDEVGCVD